MRQTTSSGTRTRPSAKRGRARSAAEGAGQRRGEPRRERQHGDQREIHGDLYAEVTARIVAELEEGRLPWVQPWGTAGVPGSPGAPTPGLPRNAISGRAYSGINILILWNAVGAGGWEQQGWLTFKQALAAGGHVRKGERGTTVVYADRFVPKCETGATICPNDDRAGSGEPGDESRPIHFLKRFTVFNIGQIDGLPPRLAPEPQPLGPREIVETGERLIEASGVDFRVGGNEAFYAPGPDYIRVPPQQAFFEQVNCYRTALHELTHATGHASRLGRDQSARFGSPAYAREELVAEIGSAFLCASLGIVPTVRHADYVGGWLAVLRDDDRAIFRAASAASRAADWLLGRLADAGRGEADPAAGASIDGATASHPDRAPALAS